ncbi:MAG TPA: hypothetical protein VGL13_02090, partial [Polyangiaceae bacterium]
MAKIAVTGFARRPACFTSVSDESGPRLIVVGTTTLRDGNERSGTLIAVFLTAESWAAFEPLKTLLLELAQERSLEALLPLVVSRLVE